MTGAVGAIVGSSVVSLYEGVSTQDREDILDCLLYADQFTSRHFDRRTDYSNWLFRYQQRLKGRGCELINTIKHTPQVIFDAKELDAAAFAIMNSMDAQALAKLAQASWKTMKVHHYADHFFEHSSDNGELAHFQIVPCMNAGNDTVQMLICAIRLTGSVDTRDFDFWSETRREMLLRINGGVYRFNRSVYSTYREGIRSYLSSSAENAIKSFEL